MCGEGGSGPTWETLGPPVEGSGGRAAAATADPATGAAPGSGAVGGRAEAVGGGAGALGEGPVWSGSPGSGATRIDCGTITFTAVLSPTVGLVRSSRCGRRNGAWGRALVLALAAVAGAPGAATGAAAELPVGGGPAGGRGLAHKPGRPPAIAAARWGDPESSGTGELPPPVTAPSAESAVGPRMPRVPLSREAPRRCCSWAATLPDAAPGPNCAAAALAIVQAVGSGRRPVASR